MESDTDTDNEDSNNYSNSTADTHTVPGTSEGTDSHAIACNVLACITYGVLCRVHVCLGKWQYVPPGPLGTLVFPPHVCTRTRTQTGCCLSTPFQSLVHAVCCVLASEFSCFPSPWACTRFVIIARTPIVSSLESHCSCALNDIQEHSCFSPPCSNFLFMLCCTLCVQCLCAAVLASVVHIY
jgi:hypothetical protein